MARLHHTEALTRTEDALTVLFCLIDDAYAHLNPQANSYEGIKRLSDSEVLALALLQQLRGVESERSFLRDAERFFSELFPGVVGLHPSSLHRRVRRLRRFMEPLRRAILAELVGDPDRGLDFAGGAAPQAGLAVGRLRGGFLGKVGIVRRLRFCEAAPHLSTNRVPISYELTAADVADALLVRELVAAAGLGEGELARRLLGDLAYRDGRLAAELAEGGILLATEKADRRPPIRQQVEVCLATLKRVFGMDVTLAKTLRGLAIRIAAKVAAYTYGCYINRMLGRPQGRIWDLWA